MLIGFSYLPSSHECLYISVVSWGLQGGALRFCSHLQFPQLKFVVAQIDYMTEEASELEFTPTFKIQKKGRTVDQFYGANKDILRDRLWLHSDDWLLAEMKATARRENMKWPSCFGYFTLNVQIGCLKNRIGLWSTWDQRTNCQEPGSSVSWVFGLISSSDLRPSEMLYTIKWSWLGW